MNVINSLRIVKYRTFDLFTLDSVARVNLVVGTNNSGKSSLLEAIYLLSSNDAPSSLLYILNEHGEFAPRASDPRLEQRLYGGYQASHIFHGRTIKTGQVITVQSDKKRGSEALTISVKDMKPPRNSDNTQMSLLLEDEIEAGIRYRALVFEYNRLGSDVARNSLRITEEGLLAYRSSTRKMMAPDQSARLVTTNYLGYDELALLWDTITLTPREDKVVEALQILEQRVERISFTSRQTSNSGILLKLKGENEPVPLGSMGDGMRRVLAIVASLVSVEQGTLLIDEIDTGLYYGVLKDIWRLILETAMRLNVQVFATTHSWDCVRAFQEALSNTKDNNLGLLIRLEKKKDQVEAVTFSSRDLDIAIKQGIEVR